MSNEQVASDDPESKPKRVHHCYYCGAELECPYSEAECKHKDVLCAFHGWWEGRKGHP